MSVLSVIQDHCKVHAMAVPGGVVASTDTTTTQLLAILKEVIEETVAEAKFQVVRRQVVFTAVASESQGLMTDLADEGFQWASNETFWDRTNRIPLVGPVDDVEWQMLQALPQTGPMYRYRIMQGELFLYPAPADPLPEIAFEYVSSWVVANSSGVPKADITADDDTFLIPEMLLKKGLKWRWKHTKGLPYIKDEQSFYKALNNFLAKDATKKTVNVGRVWNHAEPKIVIPSYSWLNQ